MDADVLERFHAKTVADASGCIIWVGARVHPRGYGRLQVNRKARLAHRLAYEHWVGPIPDGLVIDHLCRMPSCVNPEHLRAVTQWENVHAPGSECLAAANAVRTHCPAGHPYDEANTYHHRGKRSCYQCILDLGRAKRARS